MRALLDKDRRIVLLIPDRYTVDRDGIVRSESGADCLQAPQHRGMAAAVEIAEDKGREWSEAVGRDGLDEDGRPRYLSARGTIVKTKPAKVRS